MALVFTPFALRDRARLAQVWKSFRPQVIGAALLSPLAYILVLIALSFTAVSASPLPARSASCSACCSAGGCSARITSPGGSWRRPPSWQASSRGARLTLSQCGSRGPTAAGRASAILAIAWSSCAAETNHASYGRRRQVRAAVEHRVEERGVGGAGLRARLPEVPDRPVAPGKNENRLPAS